VRRQDTTRKEARERRKERQEEELRKRQEEVKRMKALKRKEIKRKVERAGRGGLKEVGYSNDDDELVDEVLKDLQRDDEEEEWDGTEEMRKRKLDEYMDEIYGLDFNDIVGDLSTRFRYVPIQPQNYALTPVEILLATDQELNEYVSVKKYAPYRQDKGDRYRWNKQDQEKLHELKARIKNRSGNLFGMNGGVPGTDGGDNLKVRKRKGKKERTRAKAVLGQPKEVLEVEKTVQDDLDTTSLKKRKRDDGVFQTGTTGEPEPQKKKKRK